MSIPSDSIWISVSTSVKALAMYSLGEAGRLN